MFLVLTITSLMFLFGIIASAWTADNPESVKEYVYYLAAKEDLNVGLVLAIAKCESNTRAKAIGDGGNSFGVFQIHLPSHPQITKEQALNPFWNINWAIDRMVEGKWKMWSCWKKLSIS